MFYCGLEIPADQLRQAATYIRKRWSPVFVRTTSGVETRRSLREVRLSDSIICNWPETKKIVGLFERSVT